nr:immunoglobulin light chain junction region [Macaca mulatta]
ADYCYSTDSSSNHGLF